MSNEAALDVLSYAPIGVAQDLTAAGSLLFDASDRIERAAAGVEPDAAGVLSWFNDLEKDSHYESWSPSLQAVRHDTWRVVPAALTLQLPLPADPSAVARSVPAHRPQPVQCRARDGSWPAGYMPLSGRVRHPDDPARWPALESRAWRTGGKGRDV